MMRRLIITALSMLCANSSVARNYCLNLKAKNNSRVVSYKYKGISGKSDRTISAWIKSSNPSNNSYFLSYGKTQKAGALINLGIDKVTGAVRFGRGGGYAIGKTNLRDNKWHHVALVVNDKFGEVKIFVDGIPEANEKMKINTVPDNDVQIGCSAAGKGNWDGFIDEVRLWKVALTKKQIINMKDCEITDADNDGYVDQDKSVEWSKLDLYYRFNELNNKGMVLDQSGTPKSRKNAKKRHDGTMVDGAILSQGGCFPKGATIDVTIKRTENIFSWTVEKEQGVKLYHIVNDSTDEILETMVADGSKSYKTTVPSSVKVRLDIIDDNGEVQSFRK